MDLDPQVPPKDRALPGSNWRSKGEDPNPRGDPRWSAVLRRWPRHNCWHFSRSRSAIPQDDSRSSGRRELQLQAEGLVRATEQGSASSGRAELRGKETVPGAIWGRVKEVKNELK